MPCKLRRISLGAGNKREQLIKSHFSPSKGYDGSQFLNILSFNVHTSKSELTCPRSQRLVSMWPTARPYSRSSFFHSVAIPNPTHISLWIPIGHNLNLLCKPLVLALLQQPALQRLQADNCSKTGAPCLETIPSPGCSEVASEILTGILSISTCTHTIQKYKGSNIHSRSGEEG